VLLLERWQQDAGWSGWVELAHKEPEVPETLEAQEAPEDGGQDGEEGGEEGLDDEVAEELSDVESETEEELMARSALPRTARQVRLVSSQSCLTAATCWVVWHWD
jgi:hypothetical protein